jgi:hypothetical protein
LAEHGGAPKAGNWIAGGVGRAGFYLIYRVRKIDSQVELWIGFGPGQAAKNKAAFKALKAQEVAIEGDFDSKLDWQELPDSEGCRVRYLCEGGYRSPPDQWPAIYAVLTDAMVRLEMTLRTRVANLSFTA